WNLFVVLVAVFVDVDFDAFDASFRFGQHRAGFQRIKPLFEHSDTLDENLTIRWRRSGGRSRSSFSAWKFEKLQSDIQSLRRGDGELLRRSPISRRVDLQYILAWRDLRQRERSIGSGPRRELLALRHLHSRHRGRPSTKRHF